MMIRKNLRRVFTWIRYRIFREFEHAVDAWAQPTFLGGLILLAGVISLVLTSTYVRSAGAVVVPRESPAFGVERGSGAGPGDCDGRNANR